MTTTIKVERESLGLSQKQLAQFVGTDADIVTQWEEGSLLPTLDQAIRLADLFGCTLDHLLRR